MRRISFFLIGVITIIGCSSNEIPNYLVLNKEVSDTKSKTFYALEVATNAQLPEGDTKLLLNHLFDSIMSTKDYKHRSQPNAVRISVYETRELFESGMGQWIGMISKAENDNSPIIELNQRRPPSSNFEEENENLLIDIDTQTQKEIWNELIIAEDKSKAEAENKYPIKVTGKTIAEINKQKVRAE